MGVRNIDFTVIIPQRNSLGTLPRLFASIPESESIEIILIDNSPEPLSRADIGIDREYELLWSPPERHAGGARNAGLDHAHGKWLVFADADDYFTPQAFDIFYRNIDREEDIIYYCAESVYDDTGAASSRADRYNMNVRRFNAGEIRPIELAIGFKVPWAKMVRKSLVDDHSLRFDEVRASNDAFFSVLAGYYARKAAAEEMAVYTVTTSRGSLTKNISYEVIHARFLVNLRINAFLKEHGLSDLQQSVGYFFYIALKHYPLKLFPMIKEAASYKQGLLVGSHRWGASLKHVRKSHRDDAKYFISK